MYSKQIISQLNLAATQKKRLQEIMLCILWLQENERFAWKWSLLLSSLGRCKLRRGCFCLLAAAIEVPVKTVNPLVRSKPKFSALFALGLFLCTYLLNVCIKVKSVWQHMVPRKWFHNHYGTSIFPFFWTHWLFLQDGASQWSVCTDSSPKHWIVDLDFFWLMLQNC